MTETYVPPLSPSFLALRRCIYRWIGRVRRLLPPSSGRAVIFCYHAIGDDTWLYGETKETFVRQIEHLSAEGYAWISLRELSEKLGRRKVLDRPYAVLTFDDGYRDVLAVKNFLRDKRIVPTMFVLAEPECADRDELTTTREFLSWDEIRQLKRDGWDIGCHSATHTEFAMLSETAMEREIGDAKRKLENLLGFPIEYFAYPKGYHSRAIRRAVNEAGYTLAVSMDDAFLSSSSDRFCWPRIGVDRSHTFDEFQTLYLPLAIIFRAGVKLLYSIVDQTKLFWRRYFFSEAMHFDPKKEEAV